MHVDTVVLVKGWSEEFALHTYIAIKAAGAKRLVALEHLTPEPPPALARVDGFLGSLRGLLGWRNRFMLKKRLQGMLCSTTICVSEGIRARLVHEYAYADAKTVVIRNGVDLKRFTAPHPERRNEIRTSFGVKNEEIVLLCTSRLAARKRLDVLLQGLKSIPVNRFAWQCWIVGSGPVESDLRVLASSLGLQRRVKFFGFQGDTVPFLNAADIYVTTSEKEGFPLSLVEAMGCKLPCIATNIPGHDEIVQHGSNGFLIPPGSPQHLADAVISLAQSSDLRHRMGEAARKWVEQHCDIEECMARIRSVVQA
jgi:glycosyltransferase involved in cell wall biosynthesis